MVMELRKRNHFPDSEERENHEAVPAAWEGRSLRRSIFMKLVPLFDRVVLKQLVAEETTKSGIVLPGQAKEKPQQAEVIAVGPGGVVDGKEITMQVKVGDKVIFSKYSGTEVEVDNEKYVVVKQNDILAIIE
jgi:chaperonin GroES